LDSGLQPSQEKQQMPAQQTSLPPAQHVCPAQQSLSPLHAPPNGALHRPSPQQT